MLLLFKCWFPGVSISLLHVGKIGKAFIPAQGFIWLHFLSHHKLCFYLHFIKASRGLWEWMPRNKKGKKKKSPPGSGLYKISMQKAADSRKAQPDGTIYTEPMTCTDCHPHSSPSPLLLAGAVPTPLGPAHGTWQHTSSCLAPPATPPAYLGSLHTSEAGL